VGRAQRWIGAACLALLACSDGGGESDLVSRGRRVYQNVCIACHNADPAKDGALGPAIAGSSRALLEARVLHAEYPPGYVPKRPSQAMPAFPYLKDDIPALEAFLDEPRS
jgi:mono/diheme cytochrome c family protein